jgi:hypothetical protein
MGDYYKASPFLKRAVEIRKHFMPANHLNLQSNLKNVNNLQERLYDKEQQL